MIGLPHSGTSSLLMKLLKRRRRIEKSSCLDIYDAVLLRDYVRDEFDLIDLTDHPYRSDAIILLSFAKYMKLRHYSFQPGLDKQLLSSESSGQDYPPYFYKFSKKLFSFLDEVDQSSDLTNHLTRTHGFITFIDINVNKATYEIAFIFGGSCSSAIIFNVLNLFLYTDERLKAPIDLEDKVFEGDYSGEDVHIFKLHTAFEYFVHAVEANFKSYRDSGNTILVGTHADKLGSDAEVEKRLKKLSSEIGEFAEKIHIDKAFLSTKIFDSRNVNELLLKFLELIDKDHQFEEYVPLKFLFFRSLLSDKDKLFVTYDELKQLAIGIIEENEIEKFLHLFQKCSSLFILDDAGYVVLKPAEFIKNLNCLYTNRDLLSEEDLHLVSNGYLSKSLARSYWACGPVYEFYTSVLAGASVGLMVEIDCERYFMPSLRTEYDTSKPTSRSNSLLTRYNSISHLPFHKQCDLVAFFQEKHDYDGLYRLQLKDCSYYNVVKFSCLDDGKQAAEIFVRFRRDFLELCISSPLNHENIPTGIYSFLKTKWVSFLKEVGSTIPGFYYRLAIFCPNSTEDNIHLPSLYLPQHQDVRCRECAREQKSEEEVMQVDCTYPVKHWIEAACTNRKTVVQPEGNVS